MKKTTLMTLLLIDAAILAGIIFAVLHFWKGHNAKPQVVEVNNMSGTLPKELRVVSMAPNLTEILFALGLNQEIVAVTFDSNYPPQVQSLPKVGTFWQPDMEAILAARPTLVVALGSEQQAVLTSRLKKMGCKSLSLNIEKSFSELFSGVDTIGKVVGKQTEAQNLIRRIQNTQNVMKRHFAGRGAPKVLWVIQREPLRVAGQNTFVDEMIRICGGRNAIPKTIYQYPPISQESLLAAAPDIIIEPADTVKDYEQFSRTAEEFYGRYPSLPAVRDKRIYVLDGDLVSRPGPRIEKGMQEVARCLWPQEKFGE
jgi:iron complex transport system substrate-binding protein